MTDYCGSSKETLTFVQRKHLHRAQAQILESAGVGERQLLEGIHAALNPHGLLFASPAEDLADATALFRPCGPGMHVRV